MELSIKAGLSVVVLAVIASTLTAWSEPIEQVVPLGTKQSIQFSLDQAFSTSDEFQFLHNGRQQDRQDVVRIDIQPGNVSGTIEINTDFDVRKEGEWLVKLIHSGNTLDIAKISIQSIPSVDSVRQKDLPANAPADIPKDVVFRNRESKALIVIAGDNFLNPTAAVADETRLLADKQTKINILTSRRDLIVAELVFDGIIKPGQRYLQISNSSGGTVEHPFSIMSRAKPQIHITEQIPIQQGFKKTVPLNIDNVENIRELVVFNEHRQPLPAGISATLKISSPSIGPVSDVDVNVDFPPSEAGFFRSNKPIIWIRTWGQQDEYLYVGEFRSQFNVSPLQPIIKNDSIAWLDNEGKILGDFIAARDSAYAIAFEAKNLTQEHIRRALFLHTTNLDTLVISEFGPSGQQPDGWTRYTAKVRFRQDAVNGTYFLRVPEGDDLSGPPFGHVHVKLANKPLDLYSGVVSVLYRGWNGGMDTAQMFSAYTERRDIRNKERRKSKIAVVVNNSDFRRGTQFLNVSAQLYSSSKKEIVAKFSENRTVGRGFDTVHISMNSIDDPQNSTEVLPSDWDTLLIVVSPIREKYLPVPNDAPIAASRSILFEGQSYEIIDFALALPPSLAVVYLDRPSVPNIFSVGIEMFVSFRKRGDEQLGRDALSFGANLFLNIRPQDGNINPADLEKIKVGLTAPMISWALPLTIFNKPVSVRAGFGGAISFSGPDDRLVPMFVFGIVQ